MPVNGKIVGSWQSQSLGIEVDIIKINPFMIQRVTKKHALPPRPKYEAKTMSGKVEMHPMDAESALQTPGGIAIWEQYLEDRAEAEAIQNEELTRALFTFGTSVKDKAIPKGWQQTYQTLGIEISEDPNVQRAEYLMMELPGNEVRDLFAEIMKASGVTQEQIAEAEETFRDKIPS